MVEIQNSEVSSQGGSVTDRTVCLTLEIYGIGNRRKVSTKKIEKIEGEGAGEFAVTPEEGGTTSDGSPANKVDRALLSMSKQLLDSKELKEIRKLDGRIRAYVRSVCLPYRVGIHLLPVDLVERAEGELKKFAEERAEKVNAFLRVYPQQIAASREGLGALWNSADYPTAEQVQQAFRFEWQYVNFGVPGKLREISPEFFRSEQRKAAEKWREASESIQQVLRAQMSKLVQKLQDKLTPNSDGKPKTFHESTVTNVREFLELFDVRNVTNDAQLEGLVNRAQAAMANISASDLRSNEAIRDGLRGSFEEITKQLDTLVVAGNSRYIELPDEDE